jgi:hypothetical protein
MNPSRILTECFGDTELIKALGFSRKQINHQKGKGNCSYAMQKNYKSRIAVAVIDNDKSGSESNYFKEFIEVEKNADARLIKRKHPTKSHYLVILNPELEAWLLESATGVSIRPEDFSLPSSPNKLGGLIKSESIESNENYRNFIHKLIDANPPHIQTLRTWITEIQLL